MEEVAHSQERTEKEKIELPPPIERAMKQYRGLLELDRELENLDMHLRLGQAPNKRNQLQEETRKLAETRQKVEQYFFGLLAKELMPLLQAGDDQAEALVEQVVDDLGPDSYTVVYDRSAMKAEILDALVRPKKGEEAIEEIDPESLSKEVRERIFAVEEKRDPWEGRLSGPTEKEIRKYEEEEARKRMADSS